MATTIVDNLRRVLASYCCDIERCLDKPAEVRPDRVFVRDPMNALALFVKRQLDARNFMVDPKFFAKGFHGEDVIASYREAYGCHPALQVTIHADGRYELDLDYAAPGVDLVSTFIHAYEVAHNSLRRELTDQDVVASMLDKRFKEKVNA